MRIDNIRSYAKEVGGSQGQLIDKFADEIAKQAGKKLGEEAGGNKDEGKKVELASERGNVRERTTFPSK